MGFWPQDSKKENFMSKYTFDEIYQEFRNTHPRLSTGILRYEPIDFMKIRIFYHNGSTIDYNAFNKKVTFG